MEEPVVAVAVSVPVAVVGSSRTLLEMRREKILVVLPSDSSDSKQDKHSNKGAALTFLKCTEALSSSDSPYFTGSSPSSA